MDANESPQTARDCVNRATVAKCPCCDRKRTKLLQDLLLSLYRAIVIYPGSAAGMAILIMLYVDVNADLFEKALLSAAAIVGTIIGLFAEEWWWQKRGSQYPDGGAMVDQVKAGIRTVGIVLLAWIMLSLFFFAGILYGEKQYLAAIASTGALSIILLAVQTASMNTLKPSTWNWRTAIPINVVGLATHYSALVIGVSFVGASYQHEISFTGNIIALLVAQGVLTSAACILVNRFRQRDAVQRNRDAQRG